LSPASTPSIATGSEPNGIAVDPSDRFVYVVDRLSNDVLTYALDSSSGTLTLAGNAVSTVANPIAIVADPTGKFLFVGGTGVDAYTIAPNSGTLTLVVGSPFGPSGVDAFSLAVDPFGKFLYYGDIVAGTVHSTTINSTSGALSETSGSPISAGNNPLSMQVDPSGGFLYVLSAGDASVWGYAIDSTTGALTFSSRASSLAAGTSLGVLGGTPPVQYVRRCRRRPLLSPLRRKELARTYSDDGCSPRTSWPVRCRRE
jgi:6-phosphogluconolactonase (cycloisomerase 2 family)